MSFELHTCGTLHLVLRCMQDGLRFGTDLPGRK